MIPDTADCRDKSVASSGSEMQQTVLYLFFSGFTERQERSFIHETKRGEDGPVFVSFYFVSTPQLSVLVIISADHIIKSDLICRKECRGQPSHWT